MSIAAAPGAGADCARVVAASTIAAEMAVCFSIIFPPVDRREFKPGSHQNKFGPVYLPGPNSSRKSAQLFRHSLPFDQLMVLPSAEITTSMFHGGPALTEILLVRVAVPSSPLLFLISSWLPF